MLSYQVWTFENLETPLLRLRSLVLWRISSNLWSYGHVTMLTSEVSCTVLWYQTTIKPLLMPIKAHLYAALSSFPLVFIPECLIFLFNFNLLIILALLEEQSRKERSDGKLSFFSVPFWAICLHYMISDLQRQAESVSTTSWWSKH